MHTQQVMTLQAESFSLRFICMTTEKTLDMVFVTGWKTMINLWKWMFHCKHSKVTAKERHINTFIVELLIHLNFIFADVLITI